MYPEHIKGISSIRYGIKNYMMIKPNTRPRIELWKIRKYPIISLKEYNIQ